MTPASSGSLPTRQQLEEIDALLKRMLSLPGMSPDAPAAPKPVSAAQTPDVPQPAAAIGREIPRASPAEVEEPIIRSWRVEMPAVATAASPPAPPPASVAAWGTPVSTPLQEHPIATPWAPPPTPAATLPPLAAPVTVSEPASLPMAQAISPAMPTPTAPLARRNEPRSLLTWILLVSNRLFDLLTYVLGPAGTWMRGPGRSTLGWLGIVMILTAAIWALGNWYGYEWPRPPLDKLKLPI